MRACRNTCPHLLCTLLLDYIVVFHLTYFINWELDELPTSYMFDVTDYKALIHEGMKNSIDTDGKLFYQKEW